ncbi:MAG: 5,10-methylene-tetrahydrofolate dehydrogenase/Methenyl tetrahydrofolate cyclohydrolase [Pseudomonadota bacterium]|jgi:methylenetetrahydrofolate dehydrogenase (NADP+)/methenyltetrahydrofolate cyclohydrolase
MSATIIDGAGLARDIRGQLVERIRVLSARSRRPGLAVILVGEDPASAVYVRNKVKDCEEVGIQSTLIRMPADTAEVELLARINALNADPAVHGILVQLPLPAQIDARRVIESISPEKDVDGFHVASAGALMTGQPGFLPCTPYGVMRLLEHVGCNLKGAEAVVIGRSNIVGKPQALLLLQKDATVTICHSRTRQLADHLRRADIIVAAVGQPRMVTGDMIKPGAVVIDVGMNRDSEGRLCGDVDYDSAAPVAGWITPVPGGVGPMTRAMLLVNTVEAAERTP